VSDDDVYLNRKELDQLIKAFGGNIPVARVGILAEKTSRSGSDKSAPTNAEIGAAHEFGTANLPRRSFLRMPIAMKLEKYMDESGAFSDDALKRVIKEGSILTWIKKMGIVAEAVVQDAFNTGGFGQWKPSIMTNKKTKMTLIETKQLRDAITSDVKK
jgi:hypothetical protein